MDFHTRFKRHSLPLCLLLLSVLLSSNFVRAQGGGNGLTGLPDLSTITQAPGATDTATSTSATATQTDTQTNTQSSQSQTTATNNDATSTSAGYVHISGAPDIGAGIPPLIVPDTSNAPFMQRSKLPEGTVFICVGAVLGFLGAAVLAWRGLVAWSLHRTVQRAASRQYASETKSSYRGGGGGSSRYSNLYDGSSVSLEHLASSRTNYDGGASGDERNHSRGASRHHQHRRHSHGRSKSQSARPSRRNSRHRHPSSNSQLFFSPTAAGMQSAQQRSSSYLPAGYYASGASTAGGGASSTHIGGPPAPGYTRMDNYTPSPPLSPRLAPDSSRYRDSSASNPFADRYRGHGVGMSMQDSSRASLSVPHSRNVSAHHSSRNSLNSPRGGNNYTNNNNNNYKNYSDGSTTPTRAPSAYLDDVLSIHGSAMGER